jgi:hypothetical protein
LRKVLREIDLAVDLKRKIFNRKGLRAKS